MTGQWKKENTRKSVDKGRKYFQFRRFVGGFPSGLQFV